jgi:hypothetical protein
LHEDAEVIVPRLIALIDQPANPYTRRSRNCQHAFDALSLLGPNAKAALPKLRALANDDDKVIADAAARALEKVEGKVRATPTSQPATVPTKPKRAVLRSSSHMICPRVAPRVRKTAKTAPHFRRPTLSPGSVC